MYIDIFQCIVWVSLICLPIIIYPPLWRYCANMGIWDQAAPAKRLDLLSIALSHGDKTWKIKKNKLLWQFHSWWVSRWLGCQPPGQQHSSQHETWSSTQSPTTWTLHKDQCMPGKRRHTQCHTCNTNNAHKTMCYRSPQHINECLP